MKEVIFIHDDVSRRVVRGYMVYLDIEEPLDMQPQ